MEYNIKNILILGGSGFIGRNVRETLYGKYNVTLANRGTRPLSCDIRIDRNNIELCESLNNGIKYDCVIDFSCYNLKQFQNTYPFINANRYIFISSTAVNNWPFNSVSPETSWLVDYARNKFECEQFILNNLSNYCIIRPCYVVGKYDNTNRFILREGKWYWIHNNELLQYYMDVVDLCDIIEQQIESNYIGLVQPCD